MHNLGGLITPNPVEPTALAAPGIWSMEEAARFIAAGRWPIPPSGNDAFTKLLLHMDNVYSTSDFFDSSPRGKQVQRPSSSAIIVESAQQKFGGASAFFNGSSAYLVVPQDVDFAFGTQDFTIDFWMRPTTLATFTGIIGTWSDTSNTGDWRFYFSSGRLVFNCQNASGGESTVITGGLDLVVNTWYHVALVRRQGNAILYLNGADIGSAAMPTNIGQTQALRIGQYRVTGNIYFSGHMDEVRISKGVARWSGAFTPPAQAYGPEARSLINSSALPSIGNMSPASAVFDGNIAQNRAAAAIAPDSVIAWCGVSFSTPTVISGFEAFATADQGFYQNSNPTITIKAWGKTGSAPTAYNDGTQLSLVSATDANSLILRDLSISNPTAFNHVWISIEPAGASTVSQNLAELKLYRPAAA